MDGSCHSYGWFMSHIWMHHIAFMKEYLSVNWLIHICVNSHISRKAIAQRVCERVSCMCLCMCMCACVHAYMLHVYVYEWCVCAYCCVCICVCARVCVFVYVYVYVCECVRVCIGTFLSTSAARSRMIFEVCCSVAAYCSVLRPVAVCCSVTEHWIAEQSRLHVLKCVLQCVAARCRCVAVRCRVIGIERACEKVPHERERGVVAVCCGVLQCIA